MKIFNILLMSLVVVFIFGFSMSHLHQVSGHPESKVTDIDGNTYRTIKIGDQWWMAENLKVTRYRNSDSIPNLTENTAWRNRTTGAYCDYNNDADNAATYGRLYNWYAVNDPRGLAPAGWHVPSAAEWQILIDYLGGDSIAGGKMKETGTTHWKSPNSDATNESGISVLPGGSRKDDGSYEGMGDYATFWSSSETLRSRAWNLNLYYPYSNVYRYLSHQRSGFSVRCVRN